MSIAPLLRNKIWQKTKGYCYYCGTGIALDAFVIDHFLPLSKGGTNNHKNLFPSCSPCNSQKSDKSIEWLRCVFYVESKGYVRLNNRLQQSLKPYRVLVVLDSGVYIKVKDLCYLQHVLRIPITGHGILFFFEIQKKLDIQAPSKCPPSLPPRARMDWGRYLDSLPDLLNAQEVASFLGVSGDTVRTLLKEGTLQGAKLGKSWKISKSSLERFVKELLG